MASNYSLFNPAPMQSSGLLLPESPQEQNLKRQQRIAEHEKREMIRKQKEQAIIEEAKKFWQSLNPAQKVGMSPVGFPFTDAIGLAGDVQMYKENPEMRSAGNYAMSGLGLLPFVPGVASTVLKKKKKPVPSANVKTVYHGTDEFFEEFDVSKTADGSIWFSDNLKKVSSGYDGATGNKRVIKRIIDENNLKLATREDADNYMIDQLINMGFDGIKFDDVADDEIVYQIFNTRKLDKAKK